MVLNGLNGCFNHFIFLMPSLKKAMEGGGVNMTLQNGLKMEQITLKLLNENNTTENITILILKSLKKCF